MNTRRALHSLSIAFVLAAGSGLEDIARELDGWLTRFDPGGELSVRKRTWLEERVAALLEVLDNEPDALAGVATELLDLAGLELTRRPEPAFFLGGGALAVVRSQGLDPLEELARGSRRDELSDWLVRGVLADRVRHPTQRRWVALYLVEDQKTPIVDHVLLGIARDADDPLRPAALEEISRRPSPAIDRYLVEYLSAERDELRDPNPFNLLVTRIRRGPLEGAAEGALGQACKAMMLSRDWREASRALELSRAFDPMRAAPMMIEALYAWSGMTGRTGSKRLVYEVTRRLRDLSGKEIGPNPRSWTTWWRAVREGNVPIVDEEDTGDRSRTEAAFFGLRPVSDRVTFIIDHSRSMRSEWGNTGHSRYAEAIEQLMRFLQASGEETRFNVILFDNSPIASTPDLVLAETQNLERARHSLASRPPDGGTNLQSAVKLALHVDGDGRADLDRLEADTVVILCDGETNSGPGWVAPFLRRVNAEARMVFHCALIGPRSDGTLEELAQRTGGEFVRTEARR